MTSVKMVRRVRGILDELGRGGERGVMGAGPINAEVISIGPQYQEVDIRWLFQDMRKPPFFKQEPQIAMPSV